MQRGILAGRIRVRGSGLLQLRLPHARRVFGGPRGTGGRFFSPALGEFVLPYEIVRTADDPDATLLAFAQSTYEVAANLAGWDRAALEDPSALEWTDKKPPT